MLPALLLFLPAPRPSIVHWPGLYEPFSALSHLVGAGVFLVLGAWLLWRARHGAASHHIALGIFVASAVLCLSASGIYHTTLPRGAAHEWTLRLDRAAIFVLIAGTFTPAHVILFRGALRYGPLIIVWSAACAGVVLQTAYIESFPESVSLSLYLTLGWLGAVTGVILARRRGFRFTLPLLVGGVAYSAGAAADFLNRPNPIPGVVEAHELFHVLVLVGLGFHARFIWNAAMVDASATEVRC